MCCSTGEFSHGAAHMKDASSSKKFEIHLHLSQQVDQWFWLTGSIASSEKFERKFDDVFVKNINHIPSSKHKVL